MSAHSRVIRATPQQIWEVLADGWLYPLFVVGASRMRDVDEGWPEFGARLHHSVGCWPALIDDSTSVLECEPPRLLRLRARAWPTGEALVTWRLEPEDAGTRVTIEEDAATGPAKAIPKPLRDPMLTWRNMETLRRLAFVAENREP